MSRQSDHRVNLGTNNRYHLIWNEGNVRYSMTLDSRLVPDEHFYKMVPARTGQNAKSIKLSTSARVNAGRVANAISAAVEAKLFERAKEDYKKEYERRYWARVDAEARIARRNHRTGR